jgi:amidase
VDGFLSRQGIAALGSGALDGLTFGAKDLIDLAGAVTGCGNPAWAATHPPAAAHAVVVEQLLQAGARCLGKTITDEFAFSLVGENHFHGTPLNPKAPDRVPGGSSCGSASVVAAGQVDFALGTDTAGSIRVPASNCGILGLRPTWGKISVAGVQPLAPSYDTVGVLARDAAVLRRVVGVLLPPEPEAPAINRVLMLEQGWEIADGEIRELRPAAAECFLRAGLQVESVALGALVSGELGSDFFTWKTIFSGVQWPEIWSTYGTWLEAVAPPLGPKIAENFAHVKKAGRSGLVASAALRVHARAGLRAALAPGTALCLPTASRVAPVRGKVDYDRGGTGYLPRTLCLTAIAGLGGLPQVSLPFVTASGLPAGVSLIGGPETDSALVEVACAVRAAGIDDDFASRSNSHHVSSIL